MHGPVAAQACTQCHAPHRSTVPKLLKAVPEELCFNCHDGRELNPAVAEHQAQTDCTRCHNGHGGSTWAMLKPLPPEPTEPDATPGATPDATPDATPQAMPDTAPEAAPATTEGGEQAGGTP
jgi:predicted CXXCH cytochrome family protein